MKNFIALKRTLACMALVFGGVMASPAHATNYRGIVLNLTVYDGFAYVGMWEGAPEGGDSPCGGNTYYLFNVGTPAGQSMLSVVLSAKNTRSVVLAWGNDKCGWNPFAGFGGAQELIGMTMDR
jgi:hypothetical protein